MFQLSCWTWIDSSGLFRVYLHRRCITPSPTVSTKGPIRSTWCRCLNPLFSNTPSSLEAMKSYLRSPRFFYSRQMWLWRITFRYSKEATFTYVPVSVDGRKVGSTDTYRPPKIDHPKGNYTLDPVSRPIKTSPDSRSMAAENLRDWRNFICRIRSLSATGPSIGP
jgi:hypothetical protein